MVAVFGFTTTEDIEEVAEQPFEPVMVTDPEIF
jgi:hypothetical protein